jgi:hypothetical protein
MILRRITKGYHTQQGSCLGWVGQVEFLGSISCARAGKRRLITTEYTREHNPDKLVRTVGIYFLNGSCLSLEPSRVRGASCVADSRMPLRPLGSHGSKDFVDTRTEQLTAHGRMSRSGWHGLSPDARC